MLFGGWACPSDGLNYEFTRKSACICEMSAHDGNSRTYTNTHTPPREHKVHIVHTLSSSHFFARLLTVSSLRPLVSFLFPLLSSIGQLFSLFANRSFFSIFLSYLCSLIYLLPLSSRWIYITLNSHYIILYNYITHRGQAKSGARESKWALGLKNENKNTETSIKSHSKSAETKEGQEEEWWRKTRSESVTRVTRII